MQANKNASTYVDLDEFHALYSESKAFVPVEARTKHVDIKPEVSMDHMRVERSLQRTKMRARSLSLEKTRKEVFSVEHVQRWRSRKIGPVIQEDAEVPNFVY